VAAVRNQPATNPARRCRHQQQQRRRISSVVVVAGSSPALPCLRAARTHRRRASRGDCTPSGTSSSCFCCC